MAHRFLPRRYAPPEPLLNSFDGPQGFGDHTKNGTTTEWPSCLNMGATFDPSLAAEWGEAMGKEFWDKGTNIQEGPGLNIAR